VRTYRIRWLRLPRNCPNRAGVSCYTERTPNPLFTLSLIIAMLELVGVFIEIPFVTNYAFWVLFGAYVLLAGRK
jgi:hypothetical protein